MMFHVGASDFIGLERRLRDRVDWEQKESVIAYLKVQSWDSPGDNEDKHERSLLVRTDGYRTATLERYHCTDILGSCSARGHYRRKGVPFQSVATV
jgi:hypothetical protein